MYPESVKDKQLQTTNYFFHCVLLVSAVQQDSGISPCCSFEAKPGVYCIWNMDDIAEIQVKRFHWKF